MQTMQTVQSHGHYAQKHCHFVRNAYLQCIRLLWQPSDVLSWEVDCQDDSQQLKGFLQTLIASIAFSPPRSRASSRQQHTPWQRWRCHGHKMASVDLSRVQKKHGQGPRRSSRQQSCSLRSTFHTFLSPHPVQQAHQPHALSPKT